jgi:hypothetical protein
MSCSQTSDCGANYVCYGNVCVEQAVLANGSEPCGYVQCVEMECQGAITGKQCTNITACVSGHSMNSVPCE